MITIEFCKASTCRHNSINFEHRVKNRCLIDNETDRDTIDLDESGQCKCYNPND